METEINLDDIFDFEDDSEKKKFEEIVINSDFMNLVHELMKKNGIKTKSELAKRLDVKRPYVTNLFSGNKYFNVPLMANLQRVLGVKFTFSIEEIKEEKEFKPTFTFAQFQKENTNESAKVFIDYNRANENPYLKVA